MDPLTQRLFMAAARGAPLVLVFDTTLATGTTVTVPLAGTVDVVIDWGDGTSDAYTTAGNKTHTYAAEGEYRVKVNGLLTGFGASVVRPNLTKCLSFGGLGITSLTDAFRSCANLTEVPEVLPIGVTNMSGMFSGATSFNQNIGGWDVSSVTDISLMFSQANSFNQNIGGWDVSNVTTFQSLFVNALSFNNGGSGDINTWDTSSVTNMNSVFNNAQTFNQNIGGWNTSNVTTMNGTLASASFNNGGSGDISSWDTSKVTNMGAMFIGASSFNQNIGSWDMGAVTDADFMFAFASAFNQDLSGITTGLAGQPSNFSTSANATFANNANGLKPFLAGGVTQINT